MTRTRVISAFGNHTNDRPRYSPDSDDSDDSDNIESQKHRRYHSQSKHPKTEDYLAPEVIPLDSLHLSPHEVQDYQRDTAGYVLAYQATPMASFAVATKAEQNARRNLVEAADENMKIVVDKPYCGQFTYESTRLKRKELERRAAAQR